MDLTHVAMFQNETNKQILLNDLFSNDPPSPRGKREEKDNKDYLLKVTNGYPSKRYHHPTR